MKTIRIEVSPGELIDRITILQLKCEHLSEPQRRAMAAAELASLLAEKERCLPPSAEIEGLASELATVNRQLWRAEDEIRMHQAAGNSAQNIAEVACRICRLNDQRIALKCRISQHAQGEERGEEKIYAATASVPQYSSP